MLAAHLKREQWSASWQPPGSLRVSSEQMVHTEPEHKNLSFCHRCSKNCFKVQQWTSLQPLPLLSEKQQGAFKHGCETIQYKVFNVSSWNKPSIDLCVPAPKPIMRTVTTLVDFSVSSGLSCSPPSSQSTHLRHAPPLFQLWVQTGGRTDWEQPCREELGGPGGWRAGQGSTVCAYGLKGQQYTGLHQEKGGQQAGGSDCTKKG